MRRARDGGRIARLRRARLIQRRLSCLPHGVVFHNRGAFAAGKERYPDTPAAALKTEWPRPGHVRLRLRGTQTHIVQERGLRAGEPIPVSIETARLAQYGTHLVRARFRSTAPLARAPALGTQWGVERRPGSGRRWRAVEQGVAGPDQKHEDPGAVRSGRRNIEIEGGAVGAGLVPEKRQRGGERLPICARIHAEDVATGITAEACRWRPR